MCGLPQGRYDVRPAVAFAARSASVRTLALARMSPALAIVAALADCGDDERRLAAHERHREADSRRAATSRRPQPAAGRGDRLNGPPDRELPRPPRGPPAEAGSARA